VLLFASAALGACRREGDVYLGTPGGAGLGAPDLDGDLRGLLQAASMRAPTIPAPAAPALIELGRALFFDPILSGNQNISCATCHHPLADTGDGLPVSIGEGGVGTGTVRNRGPGDAGHLIPRNAPHIFNLGVEGADVMFWDGRVSRHPLTGDLQTPEPALNGPSPSAAEIVAQLDSALAAQAMFPVTSREEMRGQAGTNPIADAATNLEVWQLLMARLVGTNNGTSGGLDGYRTLFQAAYPAVVDFDDLNFGHAARAIAAFERELWTSLNTPFDRYLRGDVDALSAAAKRGAMLFYGTARCAQCHSGPLMSDLLHHAIASPQVGPGKVEPSEDRGRALVTNNTLDNYRFRTPLLRNVALTGPWLHSGAFTTLEGVVRHHMDCVGSLATYDPSQLPALFEPTVDTDGNRQAARSMAVAPELATPMTLSDAEVRDLLDFLHALTDPDMLILTRDLPDSVPSGLPLNE
jgi:cytochrome c peroxidase